MITYNIFVYIVAISSRILMVWNAKMVLGLLIREYQTKSIKPNTKPYLQNCIYKIKSTMQNVWNVKNQ